MAKQRGPVASYFSGKLGEAVGARLKGGEYVTRTYVKNPKNPNTLRQRVSRLRMATAAQLAAGLAPAIQAGYGKASGSTKMYPRNMFVRDLVRMDGMEALTVANEVATVEYGFLNLSARYGINARPILGAPIFEEPLKVQLPVTGQPVTDIMPAGKMGLVVVVYDKMQNNCIVKMFEAPTTGSQTLNIPVPANWSGDTAHVYAFFKWIPETGNDVAADTEPWKYPAETGETAYAGTGNLG